MSRIEFCHDSPRFSIAHRCVGGYSHMSQMCMCASCLKPYLDARLLFLAIKKLCYHMMEVISIVGCCCSASLWASFR